jgi:hypothetical protein
MTEPTNRDLAGEILDSFHANPRSAPPDVKALAALLRKSNEPVPGGVLAEMLDSRLPRKLACNWELRPVFVGRYDDELRRVERERRIDAAMAAEPRVSKAMGAVEDLGINGLKGRSPWRLWGNMKRRRAWWDKALDASGLDDDTKARIRQAWRARPP